MAYSLVNQPLFMTFILNEHFHLLRSHTNGTQSCETFTHLELMLLALKLTRENQYIFYLCQY